ncbi:transposable element Tcb2 transposase [Trichonephila clavipes]|nr:transposable element Tcb2 transposase [Trichonephila clavipes]
MMKRWAKLHLFNRGSVIRDRYFKEVILYHVCLFRGGVGLDIVFIDDNAPPHRIADAQQLLESEDITGMNWPAFSLFKSHRIWVGCFGVTLCGPIISFGEHSTTETGAD